jgi:hypothetical protein
MAQTRFTSGAKKNRGFDEGVPQIPDSTLPSETV